MERRNECEVWMDRECMWINRVTWVVKKETEEVVQEGKENDEGEKEDEKKNEKVGSVNI